MTEKGVWDMLLQRVFPADRRSGSDTNRLTGGTLFEKKLGWRTGTPGGYTIRARSLVEAHRYRGGDRWFSISRTDR